MNEAKKILLLEDRPGRQLQFLKEEQLAALKEIQNLECPRANECMSLIKGINESEAQLEKYDLMVIHKSSLNAEGLIFLKELKKDLILFSGGLSQMVYQNEGFPVLSVNSADLYNANFENFLTNYAKGIVKNLTELVYGDKWKLSILLNYRMLKTKLENEEDESTKLEIETKLSTLKKSFEKFPDDINQEIDKLIIEI